jgi:predicted nucleotidyltransferase
LNIESKLKETFKKEIDILDYRCIPTYMKDAILDGSITVYEEK